MIVIDYATAIQKLQAIDREFTRLTPVFQRRNPNFQYTPFNQAAYPGHSQTQMMAMLVHLKAASWNAAVPLGIKEPCPEHCEDESCPPCFEWDVAQYDAYIQMLQAL